MEGRKSGMRYIWDANKPYNTRRVMHIARFTQTGEMLLEAVCGIDLNFNRSINAPFGLGHKICKRCLRRAKKV